MLGRIVERGRAIEVFPTFRDVSRMQQRNTHHTMCCQERSRRSLFLGWGTELLRKLAYHVAVERDEARDPEGVEDREQQQRVFRWFFKPFGLFDQHMSALGSRLGFRSGVPFHMDEWGYERDLKPDLLATQRGRGGQGRYLVNCAGKLNRRLDQHRAGTSSARKSNR